MENPERIGSKNDIKIIVYGTGKCCTTIIGTIKNDAFFSNIIAFCDSDKLKQNTDFFEKKIIAPEQLLNFDYDYILIASPLYEQEIRNTLNNVKIPSQKILALSNASEFEMYINRHNMEIISEIYYGLGNQMFQYACGRAIAYRLGAQLYLRPSRFDIGNRTFMLDVFPNVHYSVYRKKQPIYIRINEPEYSYWPDIENIKSPIHFPVHLSGYWQNEKYFSNISSVIRQDFIFPEFDCSEAKNIAKKITEASCSVSIHIRRGDYVENPKVNSVHGLCSPDYYEKALQIIIGKYEEKIIPELYLFSDDPDWVKNNFNTHGLPFVVVDIQEHKHAPYHDMHLMSLCQHHIIANSSFSWWGAWLSSMNGIVIAPKRWFAEDTMKHYNPSPASWITI